MGRRLEGIRKLVSAVFLFAVGTCCANVATASDVRFVGSVGYSLLAGYVLLHADDIHNYSTASSAPLRMELWATASPFTGSLSSGYQAAHYDVGSVAAAASITSVDSPVMPFNSQPGTWYLAMVLTEFTGASSNGGFTPRYWLPFPDPIVISGSSDTVPPTASISSPTGGTVSGTVAISVNASDNVGVTRVELVVNGFTVSSHTSAPYQFSWDSTSVANGSAQLQAVAYDAAGNVGPSAPVTVIVSNGITPPPDTTPPTASITSPTGGTVSGTVAISVNASDNVGVTHVDLRVNGLTIGSDTSAPYQFSWNSTSVANGAAQLQAVAYDAAGNAGQSAPVNVTVSNAIAPPPDATPPTVSIASPTGGDVSGIVTIGAAASDNVGVTRVDFYVNGNLAASDASSPFQYSWNTTTLPNGAATLQAVAYDAAGNNGHSAVVSVNVANTVTPPPPSDTTAPTVSIASPAGGTVSGTLTVSVSASDNVGVTRVELAVNGQIVTSDSASPWRLSWNSRSVSNGSTVELKALGYDAAGNVGMSPVVLVTVQNNSGHPPRKSLAIEYYNASLDHYFISASQDDIDALDSGRFTGWVRTGQTIGVYDAGEEAGSPVCRFYLPPGYGDSHFFSASTEECAEVMARFPYFDYETTEAFRVALPDAATGACPDGTTPVYRVWNDRADTNHRYTTNRTSRDQMVEKGYVAEGYGPDAVIMCSPQ